MTYLVPGSVDEALALLRARRPAVVAGCTDFLPARRQGQPSDDILDVARVPELRGIGSGPRGWRIGAAVTWTEIAAAPLPPAFDTLRQAAREVGAIQIQNAGTIAGNICNASPAADGVPPLLVLEAEVELASAAGLRRMPLDRFISGPRRTVLAPGELLTAILIPRAALTGQSRFAKLGARKYLVISIATVAVRLVEREGRVAGIWIAVGACSPVARRLPLVEVALEGAPLAKAAGLVRDGDVAAALAPIDDVRASAAYRVSAAAELVRRTVADLAGGPRR